MSHTETAPAQTPEGQALDFKLEVVVLPVSDVDRAGVTSATPGSVEDLQLTVSDIGKARAGEELPS